MRGGARWRGVVRWSGCGQAEEGFEKSQPHGMASTTSFFLNVLFSIFNIFYSGLYWYYLE